MISAPPLTRAPAPGFRRASCGSVRCAVAAAPVGRCTLYEVLGLRADATGQDIKAAYRRLARERHPDVAGADGDFIRLHDAYATLSDPDTRARYDRDVVEQAFAQPPATRPPPARSVWGRPRRTWETDQCW